MQIYLSYELEKRLRTWAKNNNRSISSIVAEGVGKILITSTAEKTWKDNPQIKIDHDGSQTASYGSLTKQHGEMDAEDYI